MSGKLQIERQQQQQFALENEINASTEEEKLKRSITVKISNKIDCSTQTNLILQKESKNDLKPLSFPIKPYHERVRLYELARKRIFCESFVYPLEMISESKKVSRNTLRLRHFYKIKKRIKIKWKACIEINFPRF